MKINEYATCYLCLHIGVIETSDTLTGSHQDFIGDNNAACKTDSKSMLHRNVQFVTSTYDINPFMPGILMSSGSIILLTITFKYKFKEGLRRVVNLFLNSISP